MEYVFLTTREIGIVAIEENSIDLSKIDVLTLSSGDYLSLTNHKWPDQIISFIKARTKKIVCTEKIISDLALSNDIEAKTVSLKEYKDFRNQIRNKLWSEEDLDKIYKEIREIARASCKATLKDEEGARDVYIAQSILAVDDLNNNINLIVSRLKEFYGLHFPELDSLVRDNHQYLRLIVELGYRTKFTEESLANLSDTRRERILNSLEGTLGGSLTEYDYNPIKELASLGLNIEEKKNIIETYIEETLVIECPNLVALMGSLLTARLLAAAGSLKNLSRVPSSTVQVLGAEKALFRHLKTGVDPPKHGLIFQSTLIHQAPKWQRGKIARVLAGKISMAAKIDYFTKENKSEVLISDLNSRLEEIRSKYKIPPKKKPKPKPINTNYTKEKQKWKKRRKGKRKRNND